MKNHDMFISQFIAAYYMINNIAYNPDNFENDIAKLDRLLSYYYTLKHNSSIINNLIMVDNIENDYPKFCKLFLRYNFKILLASGFDNDYHMVCDDSITDSEASYYSLV